MVSYEYWLKSIQFHEIDSLKPFYGLVNPTREFYGEFTAQYTANLGYAMPKNDILSWITAQIAMGAALNHFKCSQTMAADRKKPIWRFDKALIAQSEAKFTFTVY